MVDHAETIDAREVQRMDYAYRVGAIADRVFADECRRLGVPQCVAITAPLTWLSINTQHRGAA